MEKDNKIVITGVGITCPGSNSLSSFRQMLLENKSGLSEREIKGIGKVAVGECDFDETKYLHKKIIKRGTRAGSISVYCANQALESAGLDLSEGTYSNDRVGIYIGTTEHGGIETEKEYKNYVEKDSRIGLWSHHHNPRVVSNAPAGEVTLSLKTVGPHYTLGGACAAGNLGIIHGAQMLQLDEIDLAVCGGVSETSRGMSFFASFHAQGALSLNSDIEQACRPLDKKRDGIVISEGGALFCLERLDKAVDRGATILAEIVGHATTSDATDFVNPNSKTQALCIKKALAKAKMKPSDIDIINLHATGTSAGDLSEIQAIKEVFSPSDKCIINCTKGYIGHCMGGAGAIELAGNLPSFNDGKVHGSKNLQEVEEALVGYNVAKDAQVLNHDVKTILNISFGMLGINSCIIIKKQEALNG